MYVITKLTLNDTIQNCQNNIIGALGRSRTDNMLVLNQPPLPVGIQGHRKRGRDCSRPLYKTESSLRTLVRYQR